MHASTNCLALTRFPVVGLLLSHKDIDVNGKWNEVTALHMLCLGGNMEMVQHLLQHGSLDINALNSTGNSPLACAAYRVIST